MDESNFVLISALQHYAFCPRQCALIHVEQSWAENELTAEGRLMHEKAHSGESRAGTGCKVVTNLPLQSLRLGLTGQADVVEFHGSEGQWRPYPVEYKRGRPAPGGSLANEIQLCAQALCLEEMLDVSISEGSIFYGKTRRRQQVAFNSALRGCTEAVAKAVHTLIEQGVTPLARLGPACKSCSMKDLCLPELAGRNASAYLDQLSSI